MNNGQLDELALQIATKAREKFWVIDNVCDAIQREYKKLVMYPGSVIPVNDFSESKSFGADWEEKMGKTIDDKTHADIVGLIEAEMRSCLKARDYTGAPERLASVVEARLGHETPKKSCLSGITPGEWHKRVIPGTNDIAVYADDSQYGIPIACPVGGNLKSKPYNANLIAAAPKLFQVVYEYLEAIRDKHKVVHTGGYNASMREILLEAGADLESTTQD